MQVHLRESGCSTGSPHLSWRLKKYVRTTNLIERSFVESNAEPVA